MTDNIPLNADDELRRHCDSLGVPSLWCDKLIDIVEADRKKHELQARIDEINEAREDYNKRIPDVFERDVYWYSYFNKRLVELKEEV